MPGRKSSKEKKRRRSRSSGLEGGSGAGGTEGKRRSTESSHSLLEEIKCTVPSAEKEELDEEHSDIEEGGLDLSVSLKPVSFYIADKKEMLHQCFCVIGEKKLQKMLPDVLKNCSMEEIKRLCLDQLELLSEKKLLKILEGENDADSDTDEEADHGGDKTGVESVSHTAAAEDTGVSTTSFRSLEAFQTMMFWKCVLSGQDNNVDSTSSLREDSKLESLESKQDIVKASSPNLCLLERERILLSK